MRIAPLLLSALVISSGVCRAGDADAAVAYREGLEKLRAAQSDHAALLQSGSASPRTIKGAPASKKRGADSGKVRLGDFLTKPPEGVGANLEK